MGISQDHSASMTYVRSLRDAVKRRFALEYLTWIRGGRQGSMPHRGALATALAQAVCFNIDRLE